MVQIIVSHILTSYLDTTRLYIIETRDELDQTRFTRTSPSEDPDHFTRANAEVDIGQDVGLVAIFVRVCEVHMVEGNRSIRYFCQTILRRDDGWLCPKDFIDPLYRCHRDREHHEDHHKHHEGHKDGHDIGKHRRQLTSGKASTHDELCPDPRDQDKGSIQGEHHGWTTQDHDADGLHEHVVDQARSLLKLNRLFFFLDIRLDHAHVGDVFLDAIVQVIIGIKDLSKEWIDDLSDHTQDQPQEDSNPYKDASHLRIDQVASNNGKDQIERCPHTDPDHHLIGVLHISHIRHHPGYQTTWGETIDVFEGEGLDLLEDCLP